MATIPANQIVSVNPGVLSPGGTPLALNGLILTQDAAIPSGPPINFASAEDVATYFGGSSDEAAMADTYFAGFTNSTTTPTSLKFARYPFAATSSFLRSGPLPTLAFLVANVTSGELTITDCDGVVKSTTTLDLTGAASYSAAATLIAIALSLAGTATCTYDSDFNAFVITSVDTGADATMGYATTAANGGQYLKFMAADGATLSQGADAVANPGVFMNALAVVDQNWASFTTVWEPDITNKELFADWVDAQNSRYIYACWTTEAAIITSNDATSIGYYIAQNGKNGTAILYNTKILAAFYLGVGASIDFTRQNGRTVYAFRSGTGLTATVTDSTIAANLLANGASFYGAYGTANDTFTWLYNGQVSGSFLWSDSLLNAIWLNAALQLALMTLLNNMGSVPYNEDGYSLIKAAAKDPVNAALNFGAIRTNIPLSASQASQVNANAGVTIDKVLSTRGWYLQVLDPGATARANRQSPSCTLWYMDGQSVQKITLASINIL